MITKQQGLLYSQFNKWRNWEEWMLFNFLTYIVSNVSNTGTSPLYYIRHSWSRQFCDKLYLCLSWKYQDLRQIPDFFLSLTYKDLYFSALDISRLKSFFSGPTIIIQGQILFLLFWCSVIASRRCFCHLTVPGTCKI